MDLVCIISAVSVGVIGGFSFSVAHVAADAGSRSLGVRPAAPARAESQVLPVKRSTAACDGGPCCTPRPGSGVQLCPHGLVAAGPLGRAGHRPTVASQPHPGDWRVAPQESLPLPAWLRRERAVGQPGAPAGGKHEGALAAEGVGGPRTLPHVHVPEGPRVWFSPHDVSASFQWVWGLTV